jgi:putative transposase
MANKAFTFRLSPTPAQLESIKSHGGAARWIWNHMLARNIEKYAAEKKFNFFYEMCNQVPDLKPANPWLGEINSQVMQAKCRDLDAAIKRKITKKASTGFPKFKQKSANSDSFRVPQYFKISSSGIKLPKIAGWIKCNHPRKLQGKAKSITIKQDGSHWIAVVLCEVPDMPQRQLFSTAEVVGIDVGLTDIAVSSSGKKFSNPKHLQASTKLLKSRQRKLSKKCKGSQNRSKARVNVAKLHRRIKNQRKDFQWKLAAEITNQYAVVCMEALNIKNMSKNHKLARGISGAAWGLFKTKIQHKLVEKGGILVDVNPRNTSKTCSECGSICNSMPLSVRSWTCADCGVTHDRDINAAINIKVLGQNRVGTTRIYNACGDISGGDLVATESSHVSLKHENLDALASGSPVLKGGLFTKK